MIFPLYLFGMPLVLMVLYVFSRLYPDAPSGVFGLQFKLVYLPWALAGTIVCVLRCLFPRVFY